METEGIIIRHAIMHILDGSAGMPVLSDQELDLASEMNDFLRGHIIKLLSGDDLKTCCFNEEGSEIYDLICDLSEDTLIDTTKKLSEILFGIMYSNPEIPSADVFFVTYQRESSEYMAILKMNYKEVYVHYSTMDDENKNMNEVVKERNALPGGGRLSEAVIIDLSNKEVRVLEKKFEINGKKVDYLSELFLRCHAKMSQKTKLDIVTKAVDQVNKKYYDDDFEKKMEAKSVLHEVVCEDKPIKVEEICEKIFEDAAPEIKEEFNKKLEKYNLPKEEITVKSEKTTKKFERQQLLTDTGIEISIPMDEYNNKDHVEFVTNPDGTVSVIIKNINRLSSK